MSLLRKEPPPFPRKTGLCRWCGGVAPKPRLYWCSQACVDAYLARDPVVLRRRVKERDRGVCALCGRDCIKLEGRIDSVLRAAARLTRPTAWSARAIENKFPEPPGEVIAYEEEHRRLRERGYRFYRLLGLLKVPRLECLGYYPGGVRTLWEADHIRPVIEGGGGCDLDNMRTLCCCCHRRETAALNRRRAAERRNQKASLARSTPRTLSNG